jgi:hypothetical protein
VHSSRDAANHGSREVAFSVRKPLKLEFLSDTCLDKLKTPLKIMAIAFVTVNTNEELIRTGID